MSSRIADDGTIIECDLGGVIRRWRPVVIDEPRGRPPTDAEIMAPRTNGGRVGNEELHDPDRAYRVHRPNRRPRAKPSKRVARADNLVPDLVPDSPDLTGLSAP